MKIKVSLHLKSFDAAMLKMNKGFYSNQFVNDLNNELIKKIVIPQLQAGVSPVRGIGRFENYKHPKQYPADRKAKRPVNLYLTGALYSEYAIWKTSNALRCGLKNPSKKLLIYAIANNEGTKFIPARRFVPIEGEQYSVSFMLRLKQLAVKYLTKNFNN